MKLINYSLIFILMIMPTATLEKQTKINEEWSEIRLTNESDFHPIQNPYLMIIIYY